VSDPNDKTRLITLAEAADLCGFSHDYLRAIARSGRLKAQKLGSIWVTTLADVEDYIASRQEKGAFRDDISPR
jgi:excisionase family DNA binding protein